VALSTPLEINSESGLVYTLTKVYRVTIKATPAISTGPTDRVRSIRELLEKTEPTHIKPALIAGFFMRGKMDDMPGMSRNRFIVSLALIP
jgi:hypothetical protein